MLNFEGPSRDIRDVWVGRGGKDLAHEKKDSNPRPLPSTAVTLLGPARGPTTSLRPFKLIQARDDVLQPHGMQTNPGMGRRKKASDARIRR